MKKRKDGRYCKQIVIGYTDDGNKIRKSYYGTTIKEVDKQIYEAKQHLDDGIMLSLTSNITLAEWAVLWLNTYKFGKAINTKNMYSNTINVHIIPALGSLSLNKIKPVQMQLHINSLIEVGHDRTAEIVKLTLEQLFKQAVIEGYITRDITKGLTKIPKKKVEKKPLSPTEIIAIENAELSGEKRVFIDVMRYCGLRRGEALALTKSDIDLKNHSLSVNKSLCFNSNTSILKDPKTEASKRVIPIIEPLYSELVQYIGSLKDSILFPMTNGDYKSKTSYRKFWYRIMKKVNAVASEPIHFTAHKCRHTYATNLYCSKIDIKTAQYLLGHSNLTMTLEVYTHIDEEHIQNEIEKLSEFVMAQ